MRFNRLDEKRHREVFERAGLVRRPHRRRLCDAAVRDRQPGRPPGGDIRGPTGPRPYIYALSLAIYCTSWTFFGSVGLATERGLEFLAIYIGPVLVFVFGFPLLKRIVRLAKAEKITSIADFLGARYGKSFAVASIATLIATVGAIPYIALQLKAISGSVSLMVEHYTGAPPSFDPFVSDISLVVALLLALVRRAVRHAARRRDRAPGRAGPGGRGRNRWSSSPPSWRSACWSTFSASTGPAT